MILQDSYSFSILVSCIVFLFLFLYAFRYRKSPESIFFMLMVALLSIQAMASLLELHASSLEDKLLWRNIQQIPLYSSPIMLLGMIMSFIGTSSKVVFRRIVILSIIIVTYWILLFADSQLHLIRESVTLEAFGQTERIKIERTNFGFMFLLFHHFMGLWGLGMLLINIRKVPKINRMQHILLMLATLSPYVFTNAGDFIGWKISVSVSMLPTGFLLFYALFMHKFLQVRPLAKEKVLEHMTEGILIVDDQDIIIDANPAALPITERLWGEVKLVGTFLPPLLKGHPSLKVFYEAKEQGEIEVESCGRQHAFRLIPLQVRHKRTGSLLIISDITERKLYENQLIKKAARDGLTQLYNRQHFLDLLDQRMKNSRSVKEPISLLLMDLDDFKKINDRFGHLAGDRVLKCFAQLLEEVIEGTGVAGRIGGEEFAIILPGFNGEAAYEIAERLRLRVQQETVQSADPAYEIAYTISIGVAELLDSDMTLEGWYHEADMCLYASKHNGRNKTTLAGD
ncbi:histidine kinase N-terminal 7TM domain-containing diguanylate cyclase [Cohnella abietis]|uniref:GGDEF domain-containing protein n=1 Tax=Cohnella abietis TaxID=2507935 RepID=A0A3T1DEH6_9BACL|nr:diguanylate cyclase [Cohnella abietis]BBI36561.1 hypothetical protein KCTCHS21_59600 [Cohnella abietis]